MLSIGNWDEILVLEMFLTWLILIDSTLGSQLKMRRTSQMFEKNQNVVENHLEAWKMFINKKMKVKNLVTLSL